jgi:alpha-beta hydrolase superfamily lysophospholipase
MSESGDHRTRPPHRWLRWTLGLAAGLILAIVVGWGLLFWAAEPPQPGGFYTPPDPLPAGDPGTIIDTDRLDDVPDGSTGTRILYKSTDPQGNAIAVSGTVIVPEGDAPDEGRPVLAWAHGTTGIARRCAPSIRPDVASTIPGLESFLDAGYVVVTTDYPGLGGPGHHQYLIGESEARSVIDSVRAAQNLKRTHAGDRFGVWGHSQGGHASLFTGQIAVDYAPELTLVGVAAAAPASELAPLLEFALPSLTGKVLGSLALASWAQVFDDAPLGKIVQSQSIEAVEGISRGCVTTELQQLVAAPDAIYLQEVGFLKSDPTTTDPWAEIMRENSATPGDVPVPLFIAQGTEDEVVHPQVTYDFVEASCRADATVELKRLPGVGHPDVGFDSADAMAAWMADRFAGEPAPSTCSTE